MVIWTLWEFQSVYLTKQFSAGVGSQAYGMLNGWAHESQMQLKILNPGKNNSDLLPALHWYLTLESEFFFKLHWCELFFIFADHYSVQSKHHQYHISVFGDSESPLFPLMSDSCIVLNEQEKLLWWEMRRQGDWAS